MSLKLTILLINLVLTIQADIKDNPKYYFCSGRIFVSDLSISSSEIVDMCSRLSYDDRIMINIQKEIPVNGYEVDNYYTRDSDEFFLRQCRNNSCNYGYMISIYTYARKVRITAGKISKNILSIGDRERIINSARGYLSNNRFKDGILHMVDLIQSYSPNQYNSGQTVIIPPQPHQQRPPPHSSSGSSFWFILIFIICPCLCIAYCIWVKYSSNQAEHSCSVAEEIHTHLNKLDNLLQLSRSHCPSVISIDQCLLCMDKIQCNMNDFSNNNLLPRDYNNTRYSCGHLYHNRCLAESNISSCLMCFGNIHSSMIVPNSTPFHVVSDINIRSFIQNIHLIYDKYELNEYCQSYPGEFNNYNMALGLGLVAVWGITAAVVLSDMHYGQQPMEYNHYQDYNVNESNDPNTAEGDF